MTSSGICAHPRCTVPISGARLACRTHWYGLPTPLRNRVWRTWRADDHAGHGEAVRDALLYWSRALEEAERSLRCANCRTETILLDEDGTPICVTCAKASVPGSDPVMVCALCRREVDLLVGVSVDRPELCLDCVGNPARV